MSVRAFAEDEKVDFLIYGKPLDDHTPKQSALVNPAILTGF
jgi:hypothetical protein